MRSVQPGTTPSDPARARLAPSPAQAQDGNLILNGDQVVRLPSLGHLRQEADAWPAARAVATAPAPDEGMTMGVPVLRRFVDGLADLVPGLEAATLQRQRPQDLPPRLDQVQVGGVGRLEDELPRSEA